MMMIPLLVPMLVLATEGPVIPTELDTERATCVALVGQDADALYLVPKTVCDSRMCKLRIELQAVRVNGRSPDPELLGEGLLTAGASLWNQAMRDKIAAAASRYKLACKSVPTDQPLLAGERRYTLSDNDGTWWARSDNGRELPLTRIGDQAAAPTHVDGHPQLGRWAIARAADVEGNLRLQLIRLPTLAAPPFADLIKAPRKPGEQVECFGWDNEEPAMLVRATRKTCTRGREQECREEDWLVRVTKRGQEDIGRLDDSSPSHAYATHFGALDLGCTSDKLDEPTFDERVVMVGSSMTETSIDLSVFEPRERHWNVGPLRSMDTAHGKVRESVEAILWHPEVPVMVLRVGAPGASKARYVWVDLASRGIVSRN